MLAVDDCELMQELLRASLERLGYHVHLAGTGLGALQAASDADFDAIVLDVELPDLDGMSVGRALRRNPRTAAAPITMHSSMGEDTVRQGFSQYDAFVPKAAGPLRVGQCVDRLIRQRRQRPGG